MSVLFNSRSPFSGSVLGLNAVIGGCRCLANPRVGLAVDDHPAFVADADAAVHAAGIAMLGGVAECQPPRGDQGGSDGFTLMGDDVFTIDLDLERRTPFDAIFNSVTRHVTVPLQHHIRAAAQCRFMVLICGLRCERFMLIVLVRK